MHRAGLASTRRRPVNSALNDSFPESSTAATGRVETLGGGPSCRITGEGLSPARSGQPEIAPLSRHPPLNFGMVASMADSTHLQ